jgi:hypothetical protein
MLASSERDGVTSRYFPGMPEGFPTRGDYRVMRALLRMACLLHGRPDVSNRWSGHETRMAMHAKRIGHRA